MAEYFYLDPKYVLDMSSKVNQVSAHVFRVWMGLVSAAAEREDTYFERPDLAFIDGLTDDDLAALIEVGLLIREDTGYRLSSEGWSPENEGA